MSDETPNVVVVDHPLIADSLGHLRDRTTPMPEFRRQARLLAQILCVAATQNLGTAPTTVETPLEVATVHRLAVDVVLVPVLRSGLAMLDTLAGMFPAARTGFVGLERDEKTAQARSYYRKLPDNLAGAQVIVLEPMLATGGSSLTTLDLLHEAGATQVRLLCVVVAPEGARAVHARYPSVMVYTAALDRGLNDRKFILPGLGDFGDRYFGTD